ncbi:hypothetical protein ABOM_004523 [Aspergillus bombycis]|uniref:LysM domain-containing protein n=1 Tax=Aspergillus bombycis TaxID=109264 RepID=A0A1F8A551_9EURO|nr:hypothetical protein ABOM_004523 [Aspergillus bombycis]OGM46485.1 hypothetical protein ABOM_004523 [Aspergillus bombycis]
MGPQLLLVVGLLLQVLSAHKLHPRQSTACDFWVAASYAGETCDTFTRRWRIDRATFLLLNPGTDCSSLADDRTYCVKEKNPSISATATISTTATSPPIVSTTTDSSTATSSTTTDRSTVTSSATSSSSTATRESTTPTASAESTASAPTIPLQITMIVTLLLSLCFI